MPVDDLIVNEDKTEDTNRLKDKNDEEGLLGCYEDMKRRIPLSYAAFNTIKKIWHHQKIHIKKNYNYINLQSNQYYYIIQEPGDLQRKSKTKLMLLIVDN